jgi:hypothetical protein
MNINEQTRFNQVYQAYLNELTLQGKKLNYINYINYIATHDNAKAES